VKSDCGIIRHKKGELLCDVDRWRTFMAQLTLQGELKSLKVKNHISQLRPIPPYDKHNGETVPLNELTVLL
jgi:hypothetical protein